jgi:hypothetical protein
MLFRYWQQCGGSCCLGVVVIWAMTAFTQFHNNRLPDSDEEKKTYHPYAWVVAPFTLPLWAILAILSAILYAIFFGLLLFVFILALIVLRKPFLFKWLKETALKVGRPLLKLNTRLLNLFWPFPLASEPSTSQ